MDSRTTKNNLTFHRLFAVSCMGLIIGLSSCYYDNEEALYPVRPGTSTCDTVNPTYAATIQPTINNNCQGCHSGSAPSADLDLSTLDNVKTAVNSKNLLNHLMGNNASLMPPSGSLSDCNIKEFDVWITNGMP
jgi:hypothetical protein